MKTVLTFFSGVKGGTGKSYLSNAYVDILKNSRGKDIVVIDADTENHDVVRMWKKHAITGRVDLFRDSGWIDLSDAVEQNKGAEIIVSLPAQIGRELKMNLPALRYMLTEMNIGISIKMFFVMGFTYDSSQLAKRAYNDLFEYLDNFDVILNGFFGDKEDFLAWHEESDTKTKILKTGRELYAPKMIARVVAKIFHTKIAAETTEPFSSRINNTELGITVSEKMSIKMWLRDVEKMFFGVEK